MHTIMSKCWVAILLMAAAVLGSSSIAHAADSWTLSARGEVFKQKQRIDGVAKTLYVKGDDVWSKSANENSYHWEGDKWVQKWNWDAAALGLHRLDMYTSVTPPEGTQKGAPWKGWSMGPPEKFTLPDGKSVDGRKLLFNGRNMGAGKALFVLSETKVLTRGLNDFAYRLEGGKFKPVPMWDYVNAGFMVLGYSKVMAANSVPGSVEQGKQAAKYWAVDGDGWVVWTPNGKWPRVAAAYLDGSTVWYMGSNGKPILYLDGKEMEFPTWPSGSEATMQQAGFFRLAAPEFSFGALDVMRAGVAIKPVTDPSEAKPTYGISDSTVIYTNQVATIALIGKPGVGTYLYSDGVAKWHNGWHMNDANAKNVAKLTKKLEKGKSWVLLK